MKKIILTLTSISMLGVSFSPSVSAFTIQNSAETSDSQTIEMNEPTDTQLNKEILAFERYANDVGIENMKLLSINEQDKLLNSYVDNLSRLRNPLAAAIGIVAGAIAVGRGFYAAGRYGAVQCVSRGILTRANYKKSASYYYWGLVAAFGFFVANGFDDYMYGRN